MSSIPRPSSRRGLLAILLAGLAGLGLAVPPVRAAGSAAAGGSSYTDPTFGFHLELPPGFVVRPLERAKLGAYKPVPLAAIFFMNPAMARGALAGVEPPDLEVKVYAPGRASSLRGWLAAAGLSPPGSKPATPFRGAHLRGLRVCRSTMVAPDCSIYLLEGGRVYQLTAISREGEAMIETFAPVDAGTAGRRSPKSP